MTGDWEGETNGRTDIWSGMSTYISVWGINNCVHVLFKCVDMQTHHASHARYLIAVALSPMNFLSPFLFWQSHCWKVEAMKHICNYVQCGYTMYLLL